MKTLVITILAIALIVALGWISFSGDDDEANIRIDRQEIRDDTAEVVEKGKQLVRDAKDAINEHELDESGS